MTKKRQTRADLEQRVNELRHELDATRYHYEIVIKNSVDEFLRFSVFNDKNQSSVIITEISGRKSELILNNGDTLNVLVPPPINDDLDNVLTPVNE